MSEAPERFVPLVVICEVLVSTVLILFIGLRRRGNNVNYFFRVSRISRESERQKALGVNREPSACPPPSGTTTKCLFVSRGLTARYERAGRVGLKPARQASGRQLDSPTVWGKIGIGRADFV